MDYKELAEELEKMLPEKIPYGEFVGAPWPYTGQGEMVYEEPEPYFIEKAATAITELLEEVEKLKAERDSARHNLRAVQRMVQEYQEEIVPGYRERAEKAEAQRDELFGILNGVCRDMREKSADEYVCGLCEYDGAYITESGDWANECPGFDMDDCFCMKKSMRKKFGQKEE